jgi:SAM-dependent methyltransferase
MKDKEKNSYQHNREHFNQFKLVRFSTPEFLAVPEDFTNHPDARVLKRMLDILGDMKNKVVLIPACGTGYEAVVAAQRGAHVIAADISEDILEVAKKRIKYNNVEDKVLLLQDNAEMMSVKDHQVDMVLSHAAIHHLDLYVFKNELTRILKKGGIFCFSEPFGENPLLQFVRNYIPYPMKHRCEDEKPLEYKDISKFLDGLSAPLCEEVQLFSMMERVIPLKPLVSILSKIDTLILSQSKIMRKFCRIVFISARIPF